MFNPLARKEISKIAQEQGVNELAIVQDYAATILLYLVSNINLLENLVFKGGTAIKKAYFPDARFSIDLDFDIISIEKNLGDLKDYFMGKLEELIGDVYGSLYISEIESLEGFGEGKWLFFNVDYSVFELEGQSRIDIELSLSSNSYGLRTIFSEPFISESFEVKTYLIEEILEQKMIALLDRNNVKDLWDIYFLYKIKGVEPIRPLRDLILKNFPGYDGGKVKFIINEIMSERDYGVLKMTYLPRECKKNFEEVKSGVVEFINKYWL